MLLPGHIPPHRRPVTRRIAVFLALVASLLLALIPASQIRPAQAAAPTALQPCAGSIAAGTTMACAISAAAEVDSISLSGSSGEVYLLRVGITAGDMRPLVRVTATDGTLICQASGPYSPGTEIARCVLTQSGTQTINISDTAATRTGSYNLYVQRLSAPVSLTPLLVGETLTSTISAGAEATTFTLAGSANEAYLLRMGVTAGTLRPIVRVFSADGTAICTASQPYAPGTEIARCVLPQSGTFTVLATDTSAVQTGSYNLYVQRLTAPVNSTPLIIGETLTSTISAGAEATTFSLAGSANEAYLLRMGVTAGNLRPIVRVFGADGTAICTASQPYAPGTEIARCVLPQSGTFTVLATDTSAVQTGSYNLYVQRLTAPAGATALTSGATQTATIQAGSEADAYTLTGSANAVFLLRMGVTAGDLRPSLRVFGNDGSVLCEASQPYAFGTEISRCVLPQSGTFTVLATDTSATKVGSYNLYVQQLTAPAGTAALAWGETATATLPLAAELESYTVQAAASDVLLLRVAVTAGEMRPVVTVFDPDGVNICTASQPYALGTEITRCLIPRDGAYLVIVGDTSATKTGSYNLYVQRLTAPDHTRVIVAGETLAGAISAPAEADTFRWSAGASDRLRITLATTSGTLRPGVRVFDPAGTKVCEALSPYSTSAEITDCLLPRSGVYTVLVGDAPATGTGTYRVGLACLSSPCGASYTAVIGPQGGQLIAGELQIDIPPGAFADQTTIQVTPQPVTTVPTTDGQRMVRSFAILAFGAGNAAITTAAQPLTYTLRYGDIDLSAQGVTATNLRLARWDATGRSWIPMAEGGSGTSLSASTAKIADVALLAVQVQSQVYLPLLRR